MADNVFGYRSDQPALEESQTAITDYDQIRFPFLGMANNLLDGMTNGDFVADGHVRFRTCCRLKRPQ
jgi:hypothetical protein